MLGHLQRHLALVVSSDTDGGRLPASILFWFVAWVLAAKQRPFSKKCRFGQPKRLVFTEKVVSAEIGQNRNIACYNY